MSPRFFIGVIGAALIVGAFLVGTNYQLSVREDADRAVSSAPCGPALSPHLDEPRDLDYQNNLRYGETTNLYEACKEEIRTWEFGVFMVGGIGCAILLVALAIRSRSTR